MSERLHKRYGWCNHQNLCSTTQLMVSRLAKLSPFLQLSAACYPDSAPSAGISGCRSSRRRSGTPPPVWHSLPVLPGTSPFSAADKTKIGNLKIRPPDISEKTTEDSIINSYRQNKVQQYQNIPSTKHVGENYAGLRQESC